MGATVTLLGVFAKGAVAVPLCTTHPDGEWRYAVEQSGAGTVVVSDMFSDRVEALGWTDKVVRIQKHVGDRETDKVGIEGSVEGGGLMLYTSGTTSRPVCLYKC